MSPHPRRMFVLSCSNRKSGQSGPAWQVYDGPAYRVLRASGFPRTLPGLTVAVLSAEHGLINAHDPLTPYDRRMDRTRAAELIATDRATVAERVLHATGDAPLGQVLFYGGCLYRNVVRAWSDAGIFGRATLHCTRGMIGVQLSQLKTWLRCPPRSTDQTWVTHHHHRFRT